MMTNRASRRHHKFRVRNRARKILKFMLGDHYSPGLVARRAEHVAQCSCPMCGNPRKWFRHATREELAQDDPTLDLPSE